MTNQSSFWGWTAVVFFLAGTAFPSNLKAQAIEGSSPAEQKAAGKVSPSLAESQTEAERNQATESVLDSLSIDFAFHDERAFRDVLGDLSRQSGLQFVVDRTAEDCDLTRETPISFSTESMRLRTGLQMMLDRYHGTFVIRDGVVLIISIEAASDPHLFRRKMFDVENLLQLMIRTEAIKDKVSMVPAEMVRPRIYPDGGFGGAVIGYGGETGWPVGGGMFALSFIRQESGFTPRAQVSGAVKDEAEAGATEPDGGAMGSQEPAVAKPAEGNSVVPLDGQSKVRPARLVPVKYTAEQIAGELLIDLIQTQVCPDDWFETGNGDGVIQVVGGVLVVSQTENALHQVGSMLRELESKLAEIDRRAKEE